MEAQLESHTASEVEVATLEVTAEVIPNERGVAFCRSESLFVDEERLEATAMTPQEWVALFAQMKADVGDIQTPRAVTLLKAWPSASRPVAVRCDDGSEFVVKGLNVGAKPLATEQVVGRLGQLLSAPVPHVTLVEVPPELVAIEPQMAHIAPGLAHASALIPNSTERMSYEHAKEAGNKERFAALSVLYGLTAAADHQFIYDASTKQVWSVDHGHFFPGGPNWTAESLASGLAAAVPDPAIVASAGLAASDLQPPLGKLATISQNDIARAVVSVPDRWGLSDDDRVAIATFIDERRRHLLAQGGVAHA